MKTEYTIREFVESALASSYAGTFPQRLKLACRFMEFYYNLQDKKEERKASAFMNPDTITFKVSTSDDGDEIYSFNEFTEPEKAWLELEYNNYDYASRGMLARACDKLNRKKDLFTNRDARECCDELSKLQMASYILFYIIFGCHPYKSKSFYDQLTYTPRQMLAYFCKVLFIFNPNAPQGTTIEGYHNLPLDLWKKLTVSQHKVFANAFNAYSKSDKKDDKTDRRYRSFKDFYYAWTRAFRYDTLILRAPCGEKIPALMFSEKKTIIATDIAIWENRAHCKNCNKAVYDKCKECRYKESGIVEATIIKARVTVDNSYAGKKATESTTKEIPIRVDLNITGYDLDPQNGGFDVVFTVIPTKTRGVLGLEYKGEKPIYVLYPDGQENFFKSGSKLKIGDGMMIQVTQNITVEIGDGSSDEQEEQAKENNNG